DRAVTVTAIEPPAVCSDAIGSGDIVVHRAVGVVLDADEPAEHPDWRIEVLGVDDHDGPVRALRQIVLTAFRIDESDVERSERVARDLHRGYASDVRCCLGIGSWQRYMLC